MRLAWGVEISGRVSELGGTEDDLAVVREEDPDIFDFCAKEVMGRVRRIHGDRDCFSFTDDAVVFKIPALKRPSLADVKASWDGIRSIECDDSTEGEVTVRLATVLKSDEPQIVGGDYERRLMKLRGEGGLLGFQHWKWFLANWDKPEAILDDKVRAALKSLIGNVYIDFPGIIVVRAGGGRGIPYAFDGGERWHGYWCWVSDAFRRYGRVAVASK